MSLLPGDQLALVDMVMVMVADGGEGVRVDSSRDRSGMTRDGVRWERRYIDAGGGDGWLPNIDTDGRRG